jgi:hypothetical protein
MPFADSCEELLFFARGIASISQRETSQKIWLIRIGQDDEISCIAEVAEGKAEMKQGCSTADE